MSRTLYALFSSILSKVQRTIILSIDPVEFFEGRLTEGQVESPGFEQHAGRVPSRKSTCTPAAAAFRRAISTNDLLISRPVMR